MRTTESKQKIRKATSELRHYLINNAIENYDLNDEEFGIVMLQIAEYILNDELNYRYKMLD